MRRISTFLLVVAAGFMAWSTSAVAADRVALVEEFNSATCPPCVPATEVLNELVDYREGVLSVRMHMWWPRPNDPWQDRDAARGDMGRTRIAYYDTDGQYGIPYGWVGGQQNPNMQLMDATETAINTIKAKATPVTMSVTEDRSDMENIKVSVQVDSEAGANLGTVKLHVVVVARKVLLPNLAETLPGHNGELLHTDVALDMLPSPAGTEITIDPGSSNTYDFSYSLTYDELAPQDEIYVVAFVQSDFTHEIFQAASNIQGHELNAEWVGNPMIRLTSETPQVTRTFNVINDDDHAVMAEVRSVNLPDGVTVQMSPETFTMEAGATQVVEAVYTYTGSEAFLEGSLIEVRAVLPEDYAPGEVADLEILEPQIFAGTPEVVVWTGLNAYAASIYRNATLEQSPKYAGKSIAVLATSENMTAFGDDIEKHILPLRFDPQVITGEQRVLNNYWLSNVQRWLVQGKRIAVFSHFSAGASLSTPTPDGLEPTRAFFATTLGVNFNTAPLQRYQLNQGGGASISGFAINGVANDEIGNGITIAQANQYNQQSWPTFDPFTDQMSIGSGPAEACFYTDNAMANVAAVKAVIGQAQGKIYYGGFGMEALANVNDRVNIMTRVLDWLSTDAAQGPVIDAEIELDFGNVYPGQTKVESYEIRNTGSETLVISDISIEDDFFSVNNVSLPMNIEPNSSAMIDVSFTGEAGVEKEYAAFMFISSNASNSESWFVDLTATTDLTVSGVANNEAQNDMLTLRTVQNPFYGSTMVEYSLTSPAAQNVSISVFNLAGQEVAQLANGILAPGSYSTQFDATDLPGGTYFIVMESGEQSITVPAVNTK